MKTLLIEKDQLIPLIISILVCSTFPIGVASASISVVGTVTIIQPLFCGKTITQFNHMINGTQKNDVLIGTNGNDLIQGLGGNDIIIGKGKSDCLQGGDGKDIIIGGNGGDTMYGGNGDDILLGGKGNDMINGENGFDICVGNNGQNVITNCESTKGNGIQFEISQSIAEMINHDSGKTEPDRLQAPKWVQNNVMWWESGQISDRDFANLIQYLIFSWNK